MVVGVWVMLVLSARQALHVWPCTVQHMQATRQCEKGHKCPCAAASLSSCRLHLTRESTRTEVKVIVIRTAALRIRSDVHQQQEWPG